MTSIRRVISDGVTEINAQRTPGGISQNRDGSNVSSTEATDIDDSWPSGFGDYSGESDTERDSYHNVYELVKDYPEWLAYLNANPYKGFNVPESLFDSLGLSNKAKDKMMALRSDYMAYNAQVLAEFMAWKNSLPSSQREQAVEAGYNADLIEVKPSSVQEMQPYKGTSLDMPSGSTAEDLFQVIGTAASLFTTGSSVALGVLQTVSQIGLNNAQKNNLYKVGEGLDLSNFSTSLDAAKRIYSNLAPRLSKPKDPAEIMASFSMQYPDAPESVNKALKNYVNSREFQEGLNQAETKVLDSDSAFHQSYMTNGDLKMLVGSPQYWLGVRNIAFDTYRKQMESINDYLDTLDVVTQVRSSNEYAAYMNEYYSSLNSLGVPQLSAQSAFSQNRAAIASFDMQRSLALRNKTMLDIKYQEMQEYFDKLTSVDTSSWTKFWAAFQLTSGSFFTRWTDPSSASGIGIAPFSPVGMSQPTLPSFTLPTMK